MTTTPTPASPARSDKDAERAAFEAWALGERVAYKDEQYGLCFYDAGSGAHQWIGWQARAAQAQERAPSGETIATWDQRQRSSKYVRSAESCMLDEIAELREALARRATAGTTAATSDKATTRVLGDLAALLPGEFMWGDALHAVTLCDILDAYDSQRATAGNAAPTEPVYFFRQKGTNQWIESEADLRESFADSPVRLCMEYRTLYMNPVTSNAGAAPAIPEGFKLVPVEPTEDMVVSGFESVPDPFFTKPEVWAEYDEMTGCQKAAFRAKLCWTAMLAAAPSNPPVGAKEKE